MKRSSAVRAQRRQATADSGVRKNILIVEDSPTQTERLRDILAQAGYVVTAASDGEAGLAEFEANEFAVVISDIVMPGGIDGYELCRRIKAGDKRDTPVVLLTTLSDPLDIIRGLECGADNFFTKEIADEHLLERLRLLLSTREHRVRSKVRMGVKVFFLDREFTITSDREQILDLLISTFEDAVHQNRELRQREEELREAKEELARYAGSLEQRLRAVLESVPDVLFSVDPQLTQRYYISPASRAVLGRSPEELASTPRLWFDTIHEDDQPSYLAEVARMTGARARGTVEYRLKHTDGSLRWIRETIVPIVEQGIVVRLDGIAHDITTERRLEEQFRLAQKMEAVGNLAGGVAHDFNNLLAVIQGYLDLALEGVQPGSSVREDLEQIHETVDRAAALTRQLLAFGRRQAIEPKALEMNELLNGTVKMLKRIIGEDVQLAMHQTESPTTIMVDPGQFEQVLMNLCANARDAMPEGGELAMLTDRVELDEEFSLAHPWAHPGDFVRLTVSDTGVGIDEATRARIFEPFFTTKELGRGTGLGLSVVYGVVKQHAGLIHVYSEPGQGTSFKIYFPFRLETPDSARPEEVAPVTGGSETILLAEDDDDLRRTTTRLLQRLGYTVFAVADGQEAIETLIRQGDSIQLAILDVVMPGLSGPAVAEKFRATSPSTRFLFTTGYSPGTSHLAPLRTIPGPLLPKPFGFVQLAKAVRRALG